eukprot:TRINITY_DN273_c3_g1_i1.p1 TRINITY_DN273_c3_g1~~TRINITY_DN273_c3_g1_i1.p1  ORF type:complete len:329 (-),score=92.52 TRINITY_DN273_c3_g1_i1:219-1205(-)
MSTTPILLITGPTGAGKRTLIDGFSLNKEEKVLKRTENGVEFSIIPWGISNQYYSTDVDIWVDYNGDITPEFRLSSELQERCQAVIILREAESLELHEISHFAEFLDSLSELDMALLIANKIDLIKNIDEFETRRSAIIRWGIEHSVEFIEGKLIDPTYGDDKHDRNSLPRVFEALDTVMWKGMKFGTNARPSEAPKKVMKSIPKSNICAASDCSEPGKSQCSACKSVRYCGPKCQKADWKTHSTICKEIRQKNLLENENKVKSKAPSQEDIEDETGFDLGEAATAFLSLQDRLKHVPDDQKRQFCADEFMKLIDHLGLDDEEDEEEQ